MTDQSRLQLTDALIEKMLAQRAGPGAPADLVPSDRRGDRVDRPARSRAAGRAVGTRGLANTPGPGDPHLEADPPGRRPSRMAAVVVAAGAGLFLRLSPAVIGGPSSPPSIAPRRRPGRPSSSPSPSPSPSQPPGPPPSSPTSSTWTGPTRWPRPAGYGSSAQTEPVATSCSPMAPAFRAGGLVAGRDAPGLHRVRRALPDRRERQRAPAAGHRLCRVLLRDRAAFSPDGTKLVFGRNSGSSQPWTSRAVGSPSWVRRLPTTTSDPGGPPTGTQIVFSRQDKFGSGSAVFVVDADGQNLRQLSSAGLPARLRRLVAGRLADRLHVPRHQVRQGGRDEHPADDTGRLHGSPRLDRSAPVDDRRELDRSDLDARWSDPVRTGAEATAPRRAACGRWTPMAATSSSSCPAGAAWTLPFWGIDAAWQPTP